MLWAKQPPDSPSCCDIFSYYADLFGYVFTYQQALQEHINCLPFWKLSIRMILHYQFNSYKILAKTRLNYAPRYTLTTQNQPSTPSFIEGLINSEMCPSFMNLSVSHNISLPSCPSLLQASNSISFLHNLKRYLIHTQASMYKLFLLFLYKGKPTLYILLCI